MITQSRIFVVVFNILLLFVVTVSAYDTYLSIKFQETLLSMEENPLGRWLIELDDGEVSLFMAVKLLGTCAVVLVLTTLFQRKSTVGFFSVSGVAVFQGWLSYYLTFA